MKPPVLVTRPPWPGHLARLEEIAEVTLMDPTTPPGEEALIDAVAGKRALLCQLTDPVTAAVVRAGTDLELISQIAVGLDNIDVDAAEEAEVMICHTPGVLTDATADLSMALLLAVCRRVVEADALVRRGEWGVWSLPWMTGLELRGAVLGIFGMGRIGTAVARRARSFGMTVQYCNRGAVPPEIESELGARRVDFETLLATSDVVSIHAPATTQTHQVFDAAAFAAMKPGSRLVNTARGSLVDPTALVEALESGPLVGAGLDVYQEEPRVPPALLARADVVLLPHIGSSTETTRRRMSALAVGAVEAWVRGEVPPNRFQRG